MIKEVESAELTEIDPEQEVQKFYDFCDQHQIEYELFEHPPAHTIEDAKIHSHHIEGMHCKNLFLKSESPKGYWIVTLTSNAIIDLRDLAVRLGCKRIGFASPIRMAQFLRVKPGSVTPLAVINDSQHKVKVVFEQSLEQADYLNFPPLVNTQTAKISRMNLERYIRLCGREIQWLAMMPEQGIIEP